MAMSLRRKADDIWLLWQKKLVENPLNVLLRGGKKKFFRSGCTYFQVLNFDNNILHFNVGASAV